MSTSNGRVDASTLYTPPHVGCAQRLTLAHASSESSVKCATRYSTDTARFIDRECNAVHVNQVRVPSVVVLFDRRFPSTVVRSISSFIVDSSDRVCASSRTRCSRCGTRAHIRDEVVEGSHPPITHHNAASPVVGEVRRFGVGASILHLSPRRVFGRLSTICTMPVLSRRFAALNSQFATQTTTRLRSTRDQNRPRQFARCRSAVTLAPHLLRTCSTIQHRPTPNTLDILRSHAGNDSTRTGE